MKAESYPGPEPWRYPTDISPLYVYSSRMDAAAAPPVVAAAAMWRYFQATRTAGVQGRHYNWLCTFMPPQIVNTRIDHVHVWKIRDASSPERRCEVGCKNATKNTKCRQRQSAPCSVHIPKFVFLPKTKLGDFRCKTFSRYKTGLTLALNSWPTFTAFSFVGLTVLAQLTPIINTYCVTKQADKNKGLKVWRVLGALRYAWTVQDSRHELFWYLRSLLYIIRLHLPTYIIETTWQTPELCASR